MGRPLTHTGIWLRDKVLVRHDVDEGLGTFASHDAITQNARLSFKTLPSQLHRLQQGRARHPQHRLSIRSEDCCKRANLAHYDVHFTKLLMDGRNHLSWRKAAQANERDNWSKAVARTVARTLPSQKGRKMCGPQSPLPADNLSSISRFLNPKGFLQPPSHLRQQANQSDVLRKPI